MILEKLNISIQKINIKEDLKKMFCCPAKKKNKGKKILDIILPKLRSKSQRRKEGKKKILCSPRIRYKNRTS